MIPKGGWYFYLVVCVGLFWCRTSSVTAQTVWELSPYQSHVWLATADDADIPESWKEQISADLQIHLQGLFRALWNGSVELAPKTVRTEMIHSLEKITRSQLIAANPAVDSWDKLFLVSISGGQLGYRIAVREFDGNCWTFGPIQSVEEEWLNHLGHAVARTIAANFSPLARVYRVEGDTTLVQLKGGALLRDPDAPGNLKEGEILLPVERRTGAAGKTQRNGVREVDWTYLLVDERSVERITCSVVSGFANPLKTKRSRRLDQLAIRAQPSSDQSTIRLRTRGSDAPLVGYEIHERIAPGKTELLGRTDWRGEFSLRRDERPIRTLFVKSGNRVAAKLPMVPGLKAVVQADLVDDQQRLATEGFLEGIQGALVDLVARRESLSARIQERIRTRDFEGAERLLNEFRTLPSQADFQRQIQDQQQALNITDSALRRKIDTLFVDTYKILGRYLETGRLQQLETQLANARGK